MLAQFGGLKMYNATCLITGKTENLRMHALRDKQGGMIGWVFIHESVKIEDVDATIEWKFKADIQK